MRETPTASHPSEMAAGEIAIIGSGMMATAAIPVKWWPHIAAVSSNAASTLHRVRSPRRAMGRVGVASPTEMRMEAAIAVMFQARRPSTSYAAIPV